MACVTGEIHLGLRRQRMLEHLAREDSYAQHAKRELGGSLHVANTHRLGERQTGVTKRLLGHFHTVKRRVVKPELVVKGWLFQEDLAAIARTLGMASRSSGRSRLTPKLPTLSRIQTQNG